jgi:hypothetical protein
MNVEHTVTPGHQVECLAGLSFKWSAVTFDIGYNLFIREKEKVVQKATWTSDKYAVAHHRYSMHTEALGTWIIGGNTLGDDAATVSGVLQKSGNYGTSPYNDPSSPITKHGNAIGANRDAWTTELTADQKDTLSSDFDDNKPYAPGNVSMNGPIQAAGKTTSTLSRRTSEYDATGNNISADDRIGVDVDVHNDNDAVADVGTLAVRYNVSSANAITESQVTHSIVGGIGYKSHSDYPVILGIGGQVELQESNRNSALEGWKVWMKCGVSF